MGDKTGIQWTDATWNPLRGTKGKWHCVKVSEGCRHCYAETMNHRFGGPDYVVGSDVPRLDEEALLEPLKWRQPRRIFVCSMTDLFLDEHTDEMIDRVFGIMALSPHHTFQVLTKRAARMRRWFRPIGGIMRRDFVGVAAARIRDTTRMPKFDWPLPNVWLGVSAENQERADERIPDLLATPAAVRFVSAEPLLGPVTFRWLKGFDYRSQEESRRAIGAEVLANEYDGLRALDWVIVGGESGHKARACNVAWVRSIKGQCKAASVAVFVKQLGSRPVTYVTKMQGQQDRPILLRDRKGGDPSEWPDDLRVREMPVNTKESE